MQRNVLKKRSGQFLRQDQNSIEPVLILGQDRKEGESVITSPVKAIRAYCLSCCLENANEVRLCPAEDCVLHPFRFGKNPYHKKTLTDEQRKNRSEHAKSLRKHSQILSTEDSNSSDV